MPTKPQDAPLFVDMEFPQGGIDLSEAYDTQINKMYQDGRPAKSTRLGINVRTYEPGTGRSRGGARPGYTPYLQMQIPQTPPLMPGGYPAKVQHLNYIVDPSASALNGAFPVPPFDFTGYIPDITTGPRNSVFDIDGNGPGPRYMRDGGAAIQPNLNIGVNSITFAKTNPSIIWANPADIDFGTQLSGTQLNATAIDPNTLASVAGSFVYAPPSGATLPVGNNRLLSVAFTPSNTTLYRNAAGSARINVKPPTVTITWADPGDISFGTGLSSVQLNATAQDAHTMADISSQGTFTYNPASGVTLGIGSMQALMTTFSPADTVTYRSTSKTVHINVTGGASFVSGKARLVTTSSDTTSLRFSPGLMVHSGGCIVVAVGDEIFTTNGSPTKVTASGVADSNGNSYALLKQVTGHLGNISSLWAAYNCAADSAGSGAFTITFPQAIRMATAGVVLFGSFDGVLTSGNPTVTVFSGVDSVGSVSPTLASLSMPTGNGGLMVVAATINQGSTSTRVGVPIHGDGSFTEACHGGYYSAGGSSSDLDDGMALMFYAPANGNAVPGLSNPDNTNAFWDWLAASFKHS